MYHHYALAFVMTRGSIPVHWSQPGYKYRPPPVLDRTEEEDAAAFARHFHEQLSTYNGQVVAVSLSEKQGREKVIKLCDFISLQSRVFHQPADLG